VPAEYYEETMALSKKLKENGLTVAELEKGRVRISAHWPLKDMEEEEYV